MVDKSDFDRAWGLSQSMSSWDMDLYLSGKLPEDPAEIEKLLPGYAQFDAQDTCCPETIAISMLEEGVFYFEHYGWSFWCHSAIVSLAQDQETFSDASRLASKLLEHAPKGFCEIFPDLPKYANSFFDIEGIKKAELALERAKSDFKPKYFWDQFSQKIIKVET